MMSNHPVEVTDNHQVTPPQLALSYAKDPLWSTKHQLSITAWVLNLLQLPDKR